MTEEQSPDKSRINVYINTEVVKESKIHAINNNTTLARMIEEALSEYLKNHSK